MIKLRKRSKENLIIVTRRQIKKIKVNERERAILEEKLIPIFFRLKMVSKHKMQYTVPMGISLYKYLKQDMTAYKFYNVLARLIEVAKIIDSNYLYFNNLVLDIHIITIKELTGEIFFLYEPLINRTSSTNITGFISDFILLCEGKNEKLDKECKSLTKFMQEKGNCTIAEIEQFIIKNYPQIYHHVNRQEEEKGVFLTSEKLSYKKHYVPKGQAEELQETTVINYNVDSETTILNTDIDENVTTLLSKVQGHITRVKMQQQIVISKDIFTIGKEQDMDYFIKDNKAISRRHATIQKDGEKFYIMDCNATNKTYLNSECLVPNKLYLLNDGDEIKLADEKFIFSISY